MAVVIDLCSDSESETLSHTAATTALQHFRPRKQKVGANGISGAVEACDERVTGWERESGGWTVREPPQQVRRESHGHDELGADAAALAQPVPQSGARHVEGSALSHSASARKLNGRSAPEAVGHMRSQVDTLGLPSDRLFERTPRDLHKRPHQGPVVRPKGRASPPMKSSAKGAVLAGAGLALLDLPPDSEELVRPIEPNAYSYAEHERPTKRRRITEPHTAPISKGSLLQRLGAMAGLDSWAQVPPAATKIKVIGGGEPPSFDHSDMKAQHVRPYGEDDDNFAPQPSQQLEDELESSMPTMSLRKSNGDRLATSLSQRTHDVLDSPVPGLGTVPVPSNGASLSHGAQFTPEENALLIKLKARDKLRWKAIVPHFNGRTQAALQSHYSHKLMIREQNSPSVVNARSNAKSDLEAALPSAEDAALPNYSEAESVLAVPSNDIERRTQNDRLFQLTLRIEPALNDGHRTQTKTSEAAETPVLPKATPMNSLTSVHGTPFTPADDARLAKLKEVDQLKWTEISRYFPGRTQGAIQVRYSTTRKSSGFNKQQSARSGRQRDDHPPNLIEPGYTTLPSIPGQQLGGSGAMKVRRRVSAIHEDSVDSSAEDYQAPARRRKRGNGAAAMDGFISWAQVGKQAFEDPQPLVRASDEALTTDLVKSSSASRQDRIHPSSLSRLLRQRELGSDGGRSWASLPKGGNDELKNHAMEDYQVTNTFANTSGDVTCLAWAPGGQHFAAGSVAITDDRSMQYNSGLNLLLGECEMAAVRELPEHHIPRPILSNETGNPNGLHAMHESQDPRLFMTVGATAFSPNGKRLFTAGSDQKARVYSVGADIKRAKFRYEIAHPAPVDLLSVSRQGLLATACHVGSEASINIYECGSQTYRHRLSLSPSRVDSQSALPLFPSALRWGIAPQHSNFLLAGFGSDALGEERDTAGETALWNIETQQLWPMSTVTRNVFDVAWNPSPSPASTAFAVASTPTSGGGAKDKRSIVQLYAPGQNRARQVLEWECPAIDINDVIYCPYDNNLVAAGATDGKVYLWDTRFANRSQKPLHLLAHGKSVNVLDHERDVELVDTGVRFLSWGATSSRLYSGSSDGMVKAWNPYRSTGNALVKDVATFQTAIMSGAFDHDYRGLLVGEECGRINLLRAGSDEVEADYIRKAPKKFDLLSAPKLRKDEEPSAVAARRLVQTKQIAIRPMGALPIRQAVQGLRYDGPYVVPSKDDWVKAQDSYQHALDAQNEAVHFHKDTSGTDHAVGSAAARVRAAQDVLKELHIRHNEGLRLEPNAIANQEAFRRAEQESARLEASCSSKPCKLDCNYLPKDDDGAGVPDSGRSAQRIPAALRRLPKTSADIAGLDCTELHSIGLAGLCTHCLAAQATTHKAMRRLHKMRCLQRCASIRAKFAAVCESCAAPVRTDNIGTTSAKLCERCAFACFRCSQPVQFLPGGVHEDLNIYCGACGLAWRVGVLGYELVSNAVSPGRNIRNDDSRYAQVKGGEDYERVCYHSRWQI